MEVRPKYVGRKVKRVEDKRLLLGRGRYTDDIELPGMLHMAVLRSPRAHARIRTIDAEQALALPGVEAVVTYADVRDEAGPLPCMDALADTKLAVPTVLADEKVRYVGEPVAAVVASDPYVAEDALELIEVDYEPLPPVLGTEGALKDGAPLLYEEFGTNLANTIRHEIGDPDAAFAEADRVYRETFSIHRYTGQPMETRGAVAEWEPATERLTLWTSTQIPHVLRFFLANVLAVPESYVRVVAPDVGGGFGVKAQLYPEEVLVPLLSRRTGRPVKWVEDRREHFLSATHAREQTHHVEVAVKRDGTVSAMKTRSYTDNGAALFTFATTPASIFAAMLRGPYRIPNYRAESHSVLTNKTPLSVYRGAGHPQAVFCMERMMDTIAGDLGVDRAELRERNMLTPEELPSDRGTDIVLAGKVIYDSGDYPECLRRVLENVDYQGFAREQAKAREEGRYIGLGMACVVEETATGPYESATVRVDKEGKALVLSGVSPHGQGTVTAIAQLVADEFEIDIDDITVLHGDTGVVQDGMGTYASRGGAIGGAAARGAARKVKKKAMKLVSHLLEVDEGDLEYSEGRIQVKGVPTTALSLADLAQKASPWNPVPEGMEFDLVERHSHQVPGIAFANAAHVAIVEVDTRTGVVKILRYANVHDCGTVINPMIVEGQIHGGVVQGIGGTLFEDLTYDEDGQPLATSFWEYPIPTAADVPHIEIEHMETPTPLNPFGMKGAGEGGAVGSPATIVNAIGDALLPFGITLTSDGPYSPVRVLELIEDARRARG